MEVLGKILSFIRLHFFYDLRSAVISISVIFLVYFMRKMLKDKVDKPLKSLITIISTVIPLTVIFILM